MPKSWFTFLTQIATNLDLEGLALEAQELRILARRVGALERVREEEKSALDIGGGKKPLKAYDTDRDMALDDILRAARLSRKHGSPGPLSTSEGLIAALLLDRYDWLELDEHNIPSAIDRVGREWMSRFSEAWQIIRSEPEPKVTPWPQD